MQTIEDAAAAFLAKRHIAVTGVSRTPGGAHGGNVVFRRLRDHGYHAIPVNPNADEVEGARCYPDIHSITGGVDAVVIATRPEHALATMHECVDLGVGTVWLHRGMGHGSVSAEAATYGREHGITVIDGGCPCMFAPVADPGHKVLRFVGRLTGSVPARV